MKQIELWLPQTDEPFADADEYPIRRPLPWVQIFGAVIMAGGAWWLGSDVWWQVLNVAITTVEYHLSSGLFD